MRVTSPLMSLSPVCMSRFSLPLSLHPSPVSFLPLSFLSLSPLSFLPPLSSLFPAPSLSRLFPAPPSPLSFLPLSLPSLSCLSPLSFLPLSPLSSISLSCLFLPSASFFPVSLRAPSLSPRSPHVPALCLLPSVAISSFTLSLSLIILLSLFLIFTPLIPL